MNKKEKSAIEALKRIIDAIIAGDKVEITAAENTAILNLLGIDLKNITSRKKDIKSFVRGKNDFKIVFRKPFSDWHEANLIKSFGFFPFQIKQLKTSNN